MSSRADLGMAREELAQARSVVALTGAGISAESGVPTFRGQDGLWRNYSATDLATPQAFARDPRLVWEWYQWRRGLIAKTTFNAGHAALARLEAGTTDFLLVTQNVDGLHRSAGSQALIEIHGNIWITRCTGCGERREDRRLDMELPPGCQCGGLLRPDVVWFGEQLELAALNRAQDACLSCDLMLVVGTSAVVQPAASFPMLAKQKGAKIIEVNLEGTPLSSWADYSFFDRASLVLPQLILPQS